ncbi:class A sortase [Staphylococcus epidermidis]|nr:class A sortase [Staphylococcus epidermidis]MCG1591637.1 class A sortase [Staphylococcus epidermidis]MCG2478628.1 class A sortase [Staphylococcus epidermidis]
MSTRNKRKLDTVTNRILINSIIILSIILFIIGMILVFHKPIISKYVEPYKLEKNYKNLENKGLKLKPYAYKDNIKYLDSDKSKLDPNLTYNFGAVKPINVLDIKDAKLNSRYIRGQISIPSVNLNLPILQGVSNNHLWFGASTMKPTQTLGEGNYALAGHTMDNENLLFTPLHRQKIGSYMYITDSIDIYIYKTTKINIVTPDKGSVIDDVPNKKLLTLVTCSDTKGTKRLIVTGELVKKEKLDSSNMGLFNL